MVLLWSALASGRVALMTATLKAMPPVPQGAGWLTYVRCHDDIGWSITPEDAAASARTTTCTGASSPTSTPASSRARSRAARASSPTRAPARRARPGRAPRWPGWSLRGGEPVAVELAVRRVLLLYAVAFAHGGLPLIYMGDELGLLNDASYLDDPRKARRQPLDAPAARWTGRRPSGGMNRRRSRAGCGRACGG